MSEQTALRLQAPLQAPPAVAQLTRQQDIVQNVQDNPHDQRKNLTSLQAEVEQLRSQMQDIEACLAQHAPELFSLGAQQAPVTVHSVFVLKVQLISTKFKVGRPCACIC